MPRATEPRQIQCNIEWKINAAGQNCIAKALDSRTHKRLSIVKINIPFGTQFDLERIYGKGFKREVEKAALEIARNIAKRTPDPNYS